MNTAEKIQQEDESVAGILESIREIMMVDSKPNFAQNPMDGAPVLDLTQLMRENGQIQEIPKPSAPIPESILQAVEDNNRRNKELARQQAEQAQLQNETTDLSEHIKVDNNDEIDLSAFANNMESHSDANEIGDDFDLITDDSDALNEIADLLVEEDEDISLETFDLNENDNKKNEDIMDDAQDKDISVFDFSGDDDAMDIDNLTHDNTDHLLSEATLAASLRHLEDLDLAVAQSKVKPDPKDDFPVNTITTNIPSKSLEDVIVQAVQPYLKAWLNTHLSTIVEQKVQEEIRRLVNKKLGG